ncbi:MAG: HNH endonuclease [Planctomycetales bacterium]|nr:HNH endonuclease [Planctomycetales bacterium]
MTPTMVQLVRQRAGDRCEYCHMPQQFDPLAFQIDHIIAQQHKGPTIVENLSLACFADNHHKGPNIAGIDPDSGRMERLFHPRTDAWSDHFEWRGAILFGRTSVGRTTIAALRINLPHRVTHRTALIDEGVFPE